MLAPIIQVCKAIMNKIEGNPNKFMQLKYPASLPGCRKRVARLMGIHIDEFVLVPNAIHGINAILRNIGWQKGDTILKSNTSTTFLWRVTEVFSSHHHL